MKKLSFPPTARFVLLLSLVLNGACKEARTIKPATAEKNRDTVAHSPAWRIDSLMRHYFSPDGPAAVIAMQRDTTGPADHGGLSVLDTGHSFGAGYGVSDLVSRKPVDGNAIFNIGSLTKQFTADLIFILATEGKLALGDRVGKYLTGLRPALAAVTLRQLLSHCSGIPDHYAFTDTTKVKHATDRDVLTAIRKADTLYFKAGTHYRYSNTAYCLLGMVIEKCTGRSYESAVRKELQPYTGKHTSFLKARAAIGDRVHGYEKDSSGKWVSADAPESIFFTTQADGGMLTSMNDYMRWCKATEDLYLLAVKLGDSLPGLSPQTLVDTASGLSYGFGWFVLPRKAGNLIYHSGFNGGFRTAVLLIPALNYRVAIFSAAPRADLEALIRAIDRILGIDDEGFLNSGPLES